MHTSIAFLALALPWLNPVTYGPTPAVAQWLLVWSCAALCWLVWAMDGASNQAKVSTVAAAWLFAATASAAMGLLQYLGLAQAAGPWVNYVEAGQAYANLRQRNQLATLLGIGFSALLWWQVTAAQSRPGRLALQALVGVAAALLVAADAASASRTGFVQLLLLLLLSLVWRRGRGLLLWAAVVYAAAALALPLLLPHAPAAPVAEALQSGILGRVGEASGRGVLWANVLHLIALKPWLGWGWGELHTAHFITLYPGERFDQILGNAHNLPLQLAVELGIPLAALFCAALVWLTLRAKPWREQDATRQLAWSVLAVIGAHSLLEYPLWYGPFQVAAVLAIGMLWHTRSLAQQTGLTGRSGGSAHVARAGLLANGCAALLLVACTYAAWDYWRISQIYLPAAQRTAAYRDDTLNKVRASWLFANQVKFAELGTTPLTAANAGHIHTLALEMLHFSPEASVAQKCVDSATLLGLSEEAAFYAQRFQAAYPQEYAAWLATRSGTRHQTP